MSIIQPNSIKAIAHSVDIPKLSDEAAKTLAPDVEYRLREVVQVGGAVLAGAACRNTQATCLAQFGTVQLAGDVY